MLRYACVSIITFVIFLWFVNTSTIASPKKTHKSHSPKVIVSASIGEFRFTLDGFTSPEALVTIEGMGIYDQTTADKKGYFVFKNRFSPFSPREACLTARDQLGRLSSPLCLPPFPTGYNVKIGPVLLPPTLSFDKNNYYIGDQVILTGQAIPNSVVNLSVFKPTYTTSFPLLETKADKDGNFSLALPSTNASSYRLFTRTQFINDLSPKSLTLSFSVLPVWMIIINFLIFVWVTIQARLIEIVIISEIIVISFYLLHHYLHPYQIKTLAIREHYDIVPTSVGSIHESTLQ